MKTLYTAHVITTAGREGKSISDDGNISLKHSKPGSNQPGTTNPEQLFAAGYSACFGSAVEAVAKKQNIAPGEIKVAADVNLNQDDQGGYYISAALNVTITGIDDAAAQKLVEAAHQVCPYSKATRGNIEVTLKANGQPIAAQAA